MHCSELDSFYNSRFLIVVEQEDQQVLLNLLSDSGFHCIDVTESSKQLLEKASENKYDILVLDNSISNFDAVLAKFRALNSDAAVIVLAKESIPLKLQLEHKIETTLTKPYNQDDLIKAIKKALGVKVNFEIGMQFFDALFGMQMCTHRDMHQRTFEHVIRTTQVYGKFLLYLMQKKVIDLTSWTLKNCLMASLVHDIGKLLLMHGILYKEGKLTKLEYQQVKRHPWHSVTALLGGQDIEFFAKEGPLETVSGYNEKNLAEKAKKWIFSVLENDKGAYSDLDAFFGSLTEKPFIHSLNKDLLYIVFRHHDSINKSYHDKKDLEMFSRVIDKELSENLDSRSHLDIVTNALSLCDIYDALLDKKRNYRLTPFNKSFTLYIIYVEMQNKRFFPFLAESFIKFVVESELHAGENIFSQTNDPEQTWIVIKNIDSAFKIAPGQEYEFNQFLLDNSERIQNYSISLRDDELISMNYAWTAYYEKKHRELIDAFYSKLKGAGLVYKEIHEFELYEIKVFDMLFTFYYSFSSRLKQDKIIDYLVDSVIKRHITKDTRKSLIHILETEDISNINELKKLFVRYGYERKDLFETFQNYDEELLLTEFNHGIRVFLV